MSWRTHLTSAEQEELLPLEREIAQLRAKLRPLLARRERIQNNGSTRALRGNVKRRTKQSEAMYAYWAKRKKAAK